MTPEQLDDETLAAFLDDTLAPDERARVLRVLATSPEAYADFIEAAQVFAALANDGEPTPGVIPLKPRSRPRWRGPLLAAVPLLAAAGIAGVLLLSPSRRSPDVIAYVQQPVPSSLQGSGSIRALLGDRWDEPGWSVTRGGESTDASSGTIARIGARVAQLELAAQARDTVAYLQALGTLRALLGAVAGASPITARFVELPMDATAERATLEKQLREVTGAPAAFDAGAILQATRLAMAGTSARSPAADDQALRLLRLSSGTLERAAHEGDWEVTRAQLRAIAELRSGDTAQLRARVDSALAAIPR